MHIHILGICGTFMGGLAALAREAGHRVTGCDAGVYPPMSDQLRALGIELIEGFDADQMALQPDMYVIGNVVSRARLADGSPKFPLMEAILEAGTPYTSGPQWLSEHVLQGKHVLAVWQDVLAVTKAGALLIDCSTIDVATARNGGVTVWVLPYGYNMGHPIAACAPDRVIESCAALLDPVIAKGNEGPDKAGPGACFRR
mgnify:CR=1 FL=1